MAPIHRKSEETAFVFGVGKKSWGLKTKDLTSTPAATGDQFDPSQSGIDFIVEFGPTAQPQLFVHYFALKQALESLFAHPVDLVMAGAMRNPYFIESAARTRRPVYAPTLTEAA